MPVRGELLATVQATVERRPGLAYRQNRDKDRLGFKHLVHDRIAHLLLTNNLLINFHFVKKKRHEWMNSYPGQIQWLVVLGPLKSKRLVCKD